MAPPSTTPNTGSSEQPEEFPFENIIADFADLFYKENIMEWPGFNSPETRYEKLIWVSPNANEEFKKTAFLDRIDLNSKYNIKNNLDTLTQLQLAAITPVIHLYRRDYKDSDVSDPSKYKDRLFTFNNIYPETSKIATTKSREAFLEDQLRGVDSSDPSLMSSALIGIDYTFAGRNPVESERAIDVSIKMKFASFEALLGSNEPNPNLNTALIYMAANGKYPSDKTDYTDPDGTNNKNGITNNFLSLITHPPSDTQLEEYQYAARNTGSRIYYPNKFRVYLKLGWRILDSADHINILFPNDQYKEFVESINKGDHDKAMLLNLINHELTFNEEGEVELKVNYIGSLDTNITSGDSDFIGALYEQVLNKATEGTTDTTDATLDAIEQINKWSNRGCGKITNDDPIDKKLEALDEAANKAKTELKDARQNALNETYSEFLKYLLEHGGYKSIKAMSISGKQAEEYANAMADTERPKQKFYDLKGNKPYSSADALKDAKSDTAEVTTKINITNKDGWFDSGAAFLDNLQDATPFVESSGERLEKLQENKVRIDPSGFNDDPLNQIFKLVTVGSLLDGMLQLLDKKINLTRKGVNVGDFMKSFYIVLGEYYYYPRSVGALPERLPIALLPINFDTFLIWFKDNIVTKQRKNYVLKDFLTDFFTQLVIPTLRGYDSNGKIGRQYSVFFDQKEIKAYEFKDKAGKPTPFKLKAAREDYRNIDNNLVDSMKTVTPPTGATPKDYNIIYVSMKVSDPDSRGRVFENIQKDREENISHFWVGDTKGLIKSVKFKRIEQPGLKEAKATKESFIPLNQLRDLYNTDISMFGNHYYYPGDMVFVHPQNNVLGEPYKVGSISNIMGIGGYYDVIKVSSNIGEGGYETNLECIWTCSGEQFEKSKELKEKECQKIVDDYNAAANKTTLGSGDVLKK